MIACVSETVSSPRATTHPLSSTHKLSSSSVSSASAPEHSFWKQLPSRAAGIAHSSAAKVEGVSMELSAGGGSAFEGWGRRAVGK